MAQHACMHGSTPPVALVPTRIEVSSLLRLSTPAVHARSQRGRFHSPIPRRSNMHAANRSSRVLGSRSCSSERQPLASGKPQPLATWAPPAAAPGRTTEPIRCPAAVSKLSCEIDSPTVQRAGRCRRKRDSGTTASGPAPPEALDLQPVASRNVSWES